MGHRFDKNFEVLFFHESQEEGLAKSSANASLSSSAVKGL
jgi:hypothetical protein